jgi:ferredoxin
MVSELYCDGLGACIGECHAGAIAVEEREAEPYSEAAVMERLAPKGEATVMAHLRHLEAHGEMALLREGLDYLEAHGLQMSYRPESEPLACGCPGSAMREVSPTDTDSLPAQSQASELRQFPVQLRLINPHAGFFVEADLLLAADCTAFALGDFHSRFLRGKRLAIACPKLDEDLQSYVAKLSELIRVARIRSLTVLIMEVPCCRGLLKLANLAVAASKPDLPLSVAVVSVSGEIIE